LVFSYLTPITGTLQKSGSEWNAGFSGSDGTRYVGGVFNMQPHGSGTITHSDGGGSEGGDYRNGKSHGRMWWRGENSRGDGKYRDGVAYGLHKESRYDGEVSSELKEHYVDGRRHGVSEMKINHNKTGSSLRIFHYIEGKPEGLFKMVFDGPTGKVTWNGALTRYGAVRDALAIRNGVVMARKDLATEEWSVEKAMGQWLFESMGDESLKGMFSFGKSREDSEIECKPEKGIIGKIMGSFCKVVSRDNEIVEIAKVMGVVFQSQVGFSKLIGGKSVGVRTRITGFPGVADFVRPKIAEAIAENRN